MLVQVKSSDCWHWKKILKVRDALRDGLCDDNWAARINGEYNTTAAYKWLVGPKPVFKFHRLVWQRLVSPKHAFIFWLVLLRKLLTLDRLSSWGIPNVDMSCILCEFGNESINHLFFSCDFSRQIVVEIAHWLQWDSCPIAHNRWRAWLGYARHRPKEKNGHLDCYNGCVHLENLAREKQ